MASSINNSAWLEWMTAMVGGVSRQSYAATFPPDRYYCALDELPLHLLPQDYARRLRSELDDGPYYLNPDCMMSEGEHLPEELAPYRDLLSDFALQGTIAWVRDSLSGLYLPFWLGPELEKAVQTLHSGEFLAPSLAVSTRRLLAGSGIVISAKRTSRQTCARRKQLSVAAAQFQSKGYAPLSDLIHPFHIAALRRYYRYHIRSGKIRLGDRQSPLRYVAYNDSVARFFHRQLAATFSAIAGEALRPSYVYLASYLSGAELKKHTDREQCEFSITLCLDFSPEPELATPWPIQLDSSAGTVTVYQGLGDGLAYRGTRLPHYRAPLGVRQTSTSIFFHYVGADFAGSLD
jgi:hypothetical protein